MDYENKDMHNNAPGNGSGAAYCPKCGAANEPGRSFCTACGEQMQAPPMTQGASYGGGAGFSGGPYSETDQDLMLFLQKNEFFYIGKFNTMAASNGKVSWNWPAFLAGFFWMIYRKMYLFAAAYFGISLVLSAIKIPFIGIILMVCSGLFGNLLYKNTVDKHMSIARSMPEPGRRSYILAKGGTNLAAALIILGIFVLLMIIAVIVIVSVMGGIYSSLMY